MRITVIVFSLAILSYANQDGFILRPGDAIEATSMNQWDYYRIPGSYYFKTYVRIWIQIKPSQGHAKLVLALSHQKPLFLSNHSSVIAEFVDLEDYYSDSNYHSIILHSSNISNWSNVYIGVGNEQFESSSVRYEIGLDVKDRILCPNDCSGQGNCVSLNKCACYSNFIGKNCMISAVEIKESESVLIAPVYQNTYGYINTNSISSNEIQLEMEWEGVSGILLLNYDGNVPSSLPSIYSYYLSIILQGSDNSMSINIDVTNIEDRLYFLLYNKINSDHSLNLYIRYKESNPSEKEKSVLWWSISVVAGFTIFVIAVTLFCKWKKCWLFNATMLEQEGSPGLAASFINKKYPTIKFSNITSLQTPAMSCAICFEQFDKNSMVRMLFCNHVFHTTCIEEWFLISKTCCLCKKDCSSEDSAANPMDNNSSICETEDSSKSNLMISDEKGI